MLKTFQVENYKGFKKELTWDLSATRDYSYHKGLVQNKIVKKALIFGENGSGKPCLCTALLDLTAHLLDTQKEQTPPHLYTYAKSAPTELLLETVTVNGKKCCCIILRMGRKIL